MRQSINTSRLLVRNGTFRRDGVQQPHTWRGNAGGPVGRFITLSLLVVIAAFTGVGTARYCPGCLDRGRVNKGCQWTGDSAFPIDWQNTAHRRHLIADAQLAEDLAIRYADAEFNRLYGYEAHGGL